MSEEDKKKKTAEAEEKSGENSLKMVKKLRAETEKYKEEAARCQDQATRALADYQNLLRHQKEDQGKMVAVARSVIFESLLQPLTHLSLAAQNLNDQGLNMVVGQFWQTLHEQGLQEICPVGEKFDPARMEAIEKVGEGEVVKEVLTPGYQLGEQVLQVAKVKVG